MNIPSLLALSAVLLSGGGAAQAAQNADSGYDLYRRAVLGDTRIAAPAVMASTRSYGPYALARLHAGVDGRVALAEARAIGEEPPAPRLQAPRATLSGYDLYRRAVLGEDLRIGTPAPSSTLAAGTPR